MRKTLLGVLVAALAAGAGMPPGAAATADRQAELQALRETIARIQSRLQTLEQRHKHTARALAKSERDINRRLHRTRELEAARRKQVAELQQLERERGVHLKRLRAQRRSLRGALSSAYALRQQGTLRILLSLSEPAAVGRSLKYHEYVQRAHGARIAAVQSTVAALDAVADQIQAKRDALDLTLLTERAELDQLRKAREERRRVLAALDQEINSKQKRLARLKEDEAALADIVKELDRALGAQRPRDRRPFASLKGKMPLPAKGPVTAHFGRRRLHSQLKWQGIVIAAPIGSDVTAIATGRVVFADWLRG
ncbi:MAG TPA: hypothetical protein ENJ19_12400, partial [Gammaproteobacteria bacterium]|nr:hypothetical protein [Gammaproteobacteria bacterium]